MTIEQRYGCIIEFGCTAVSNHRYPPKKSNTECRSDAALKVNMAEDGNQAGIGHITTLDISLL